jgi:hypothetical protein
VEGSAPTFQKRLQLKGIGFKALFFSGKLERFVRRFEAELVPILETVGDCFSLTLVDIWRDFVSNYVTLSRYAGITTAGRQGYFCGG